MREVEKVAHLMSQSNTDHLWLTQELGNPVQSRGTSSLKDAFWEGACPCSLQASQLQ